MANSASILAKSSEKCYLQVAHVFNRFKWFTSSSPPAFAENKITKKGGLGDRFNIDLEVLIALRRAEFVTSMDDRPWGIRFPYLGLSCIYVIYSPYLNSAI
jgi:hypothetical protein